MGRPYLRTLLIRVNGMFWPLYSLSTQKQVGKVVRSQKQQQYLFLSNFGSVFIQYLSCSKTGIASHHEHQSKISPIPVIGLKFRAE
jgi:hypothetical protein